MELLSKTNLGAFARTPCILSRKIEDYRSSRINSSGKISLKISNKTYSFHSPENTYLELCFVLVCFIKKTLPLFFNLMSHERKAAGSAHSTIKSRNEEVKIKVETNLKPPLSQGMKRVTQISRICTKYIRVVVIGSG